MKIPISGRKKALLIVDAQPAFITNRNSYVLENICRLLSRMDYEFYAQTLFHAEKGSLWDRQHGWTRQRKGGYHTNEKVLALLAGKKCVRCEKSSKSAFKGSENLAALFKSSGIEEVHIVGFDTNVCVLASAFESFDLGFFTYVIEECCEASESSALHKLGVSILRAQNMANNSCVEKVKLLKI